MYIIRLSFKHINHLLQILIATIILTSGACTQESSKIQIPQSPLLRSFERKSGSIAFIGSDGNVFSMDQAGDNIMQITDNATLSEGKVLYYTHIAWSPDSEKIAYVSYSGTSIEEMSAKLYVSNKNGNNSQEIFTGNNMIPIFLYWSPNSKSLAFLSTQTNGNSGILRLSYLDGKDSLIIDSGQPLFWAWAPSSKRILIHSNGSSYDSRIAYLYLGDSITEESLLTDSGSFQVPAFSPNGEEIIYAAKLEDDKNAIVATNRISENKKIITTVKGNTSFDYSPDGRHIAYIDNKTNTNNNMFGTLNIIQTQNENTKKLFNIADNVIGFFWSPNGEKVAYFKSTQETDDNNLRLIDLNIFSVIDETNQNAFRFTPSELFGALLPYLDQYQRTFTIWSPDSKYITVSAYTENGPAIFVVQPEGNFTPRIVEFGMLSIWSWK
tara:strand:- start:1178 stop:2491 length:1314 start_codon:yes stop_codon:yes gene_type:complete